MADLRTAANEADRIWSNEVLRLIQRRFPHIPMSQFGDEPRAALVEFARDVTALAQQQAEPVQRKPLTEDEIEALFKGVDSEDKGRFAIVRGFARAIEQAHGIGKESSDER